ncbi:hypothetical protein TNCV_4980821 [Trichonephila clavipes]|nr:hypothetical protein TNCV_4980821 [Trichonephila clavipes]
MGIITAAFHAFGKFLSLNMLLMMLVILTNQRAPLPLWTLGISLVDGATVPLRDRNIKDSCHLIGQAVSLPLSEEKTTLSHLLRESDDDGLNSCDVTTSHESSSALAHVHAASIVHNNLALKL